MGQQPYKEPELRYTGCLASRLPLPQKLHRLERCNGRRVPHEWRRTATSISYLSRHRSHRSLTPLGARGAVTSMGWLQSTVLERTPNTRTSALKPQTDHIYLGQRKRVGGTTTVQDTGIPLHTSSSKFCREVYGNGGPGLRTAGCRPYIRSTARNATHHSVA